MDRELELDLVARLRAGAPEAFDAVYERFNTPLYSFLARLSRRREVAEDLLEETWLRLVAKAPTLRDDTRLAPWLFTVARNLYVSYRRSRAVEDSHAEGLLGLWPAGTPGPSPFDVASGLETERRLEEALGALSFASREVLLLVAVEGLTPAEAAEVCGVSPQAMRQRLSRGRAELARRLEEREAPGLASLREVKA